jgi:hypothetical protein
MIYTSEAPVRTQACPSGATGPQRGRFLSEQATDRQTGYITSKLYFFRFFSHISCNCIIYRTIGVTGA